MTIVLWMSSYPCVPLLKLVLGGSSYEGFLKLELGRASQTLDILLEIKLDGLLRTIKDILEITDAH